MNLNRLHFFVYSILTGLLLGIAFGSKIAFPIIFIAYIPLLFLENYFHENPTKYSKSYKFSFFYLAFVIYNLSAAWWTYKSSIVGFLAIMSLNSLYLTLAFWLFHISKKHLHKSIHILSFAAFWISMEYIHYHWEFSWPWLSLGNSLANQVNIIQWYEFTGVLGGTAWILITNYTLYILIRLIVNNKNIKLILISSLLIIITPITISQLQFKYVKEGSEIIKIALIQPNFASYSEKYELSPDVQFKSIINLTNNVLKSDIDYLIYPETSLPYLLNQDSLYNHPIINAFKKYHSIYLTTSFILGSSTYKILNKPIQLNQYAKQFPNGDNYKAYNTALFIENNKKIQLHNKSKFVLGAEKMPFGETFSFLESLFPNLGGIVGSIVPDTAFMTFYNENKKHKIIPVICYESAYGSYLANEIDTNNCFIAIITNDDWWGNSPGYKQHLMLSRIRAIELRKSIARCANTGISAFINTKGEIIKSTEWRKTLSITGSIHLNNKQTFYSRFPDFIGILSIAICLTLIFFHIISLTRK